MKLASFFWYLPLYVVQEDTEKYYFGCHLYNFVILSEICKADVQINWK